MRGRWFRPRAPSSAESWSLHLQRDRHANLKVTSGEKADALPPLPDRTGWIPARVRIADFPKLKELAWQIHGTSELTPREALGIYERNWRHLDPTTLPSHERDLVDALRQGLGSDPVV